MLTSTQSSTIELNEKSNPPIDSVTWKIIYPYKVELDNKMNEIIITSDQPLVKGEPEGNLGNCVADIILKQSNKMYDSKAVKIDFCFLNNGGLRTSLPKGDITLGKLFELMPFENEMVVLTMSGDKMKLLFKFIAEKNGVPVSGIKMGIKNKAPQTITINNEPFDENITYRVVTSDYLANGGDNLEFLKTDVFKEPLQYKLRDAIIDYLRAEHLKGNNLVAKTDGRIYYE